MWNPTAATPEIAAAEATVEAAARRVSEHPFSLRYRQDYNAALAALEALYNAYVTRPRRG